MTDSTIEDDSPLMVDCGVHGKRIAAVVCRHMLNAHEEVVGFVENSADPNDLQAWCDKCEAFKPLQFGRYEGSQGLTMLWFCMECK